MRQRRSLCVAPIPYARRSRTFTCRWTRADLRTACTRRGSARAASSAAATPSSCTKRGASGRCICAWRRGMHRSARCTLTSPTSRAGRARRARRMASSRRSRDGAIRTRRRSCCARVWGMCVCSRTGRTSRASCRSCARRHHRGRRRRRRASRRSSSSARSTCTPPTASASTSHARI